MGRVRRRAAESRARAAAGGGFRDFTAGGWDDGADLNHLNDEDVRRLREVLLRALEREAREREASEGYRQHQRRRSARGGMLGWLIAAVFNAVLGLVGAIVSEVFPRREEYDQRRGRGWEGEGDGEDEEEERFGRARGGAGGGGGRKKKRTTEGTEDGTNAAMKAQDPFEVLGLAKEGATEEDVMRAYKQLARKWHPDKNNQSEESTRMMQMINAARQSCVQQLKGGGAPPPVGGPDGSDDDTAGPGHSGTDDSDDDVGGPDGAEKAARRAERLFRKQAEATQREYTRKRREERQRMRAETKHPGGRFRRQQAAHGVGADGRPKEGGAANQDAASGKDKEDGRDDTLRRRGSAGNRKKHRAKKDKSRFADLAGGEGTDTSESDNDSCAGPGQNGTLPGVKRKVRAHHRRMEQNRHEVACAARAGAAIVLFELLQFDFPPLLEVDSDGNTPLHYVARFDPSLVDTVMNVVGPEWERAVLLKNRYGETPADLLTPAVEHADAKTVAAADKEPSSAEAEARAEASNRCAARLRQLTDAAIEAARRRDEIELRTFDPSGVVRLCTVGAAAFGVGYAVLRVCAVARAPEWFGVLSSMGLALASGRLVMSKLRPGTGGVKEG